MKRRLMDFVALPGCVDQVLSINDSIRALARKYMHAKNFLYLGGVSTIPSRWRGRSSSRRSRIYTPRGTPPAR